MKKAMFQGGLWRGSLFQGGLYLSNGDDVETEAQTVVIDVEDNHGDETYVGIRGIRFFLRGILVQIISFLAYESSKLSAAYAASNVFDLTKSLTGAWEGNSWIPAEGLTTNQRIIAVFPGKIKFDQIVIHNLHNSGSTVSAGVKALKVAISKSTYTDTTPAAAVTNGETIFDGEIPAHPAEDVEAPAEVEYTPPVQTVAEYTVTYAGNSQDSGTAPTDSETYDLGDSVTVLGQGDLLKTGYGFSGWNTAADGSGTDYAAAATFEISGDVTLYAKWVSTTWTPAEEETLFWIAASSLTGSDDSAVSAWDDLSEGDFNLTTGNAATLKTNVLNSTPIVRFNGTDDYLINSTFDALHGLSSFSAFFVVKSTTPADNNILLSFGSNLSFQIYNNLFIATISDSNNGSVPYSNSTDFSIFSIFYDGSKSTNAEKLRVKINGGDDIAVTFAGTIPASISHSDGISIGRVYASAAAPFEGDVSELWLGPLSTDRYKAEGYLAAKLGLQGNLPGWHPYKSAGPIIGEATPAVSAYQAKSVVLDIANNWGHASYLGIRSIDFYYDNTKITKIATDFTAYATTTLNANELPAFAFNTSLSKTGSVVNTSWMPSATTNQRLIVVFDEQTTFNKIVVNNMHHNGTWTDGGAKDAKIRISTDIITSTVYNEAVANSTLIFDGQLAQHVAADSADDQVLALT